MSKKSQFANSSSNSGASILFYMLCLLLLVVLVGMYFLQSQRMEELESKYISLQSSVAKMPKVMQAENLEQEIRSDRRIEELEARMIELSEAARQRRTEEFVLLNNQLGVLNGLVARVEGRVSSTENQIANGYKASIDAIKKIEQGLEFVEANIVERMSKLQGDFQSDTAPQSEFENLIEFKQLSLELDERALDDVGHKISNDGRPLCILGVRVAVTNNSPNSQRVKYSEVRMPSPFGARPFISTDRWHDNFRKDYTWVMLGYQTMSMRFGYAIDKESARQLLSPIDPKTLRTHFDKPHLFQVEVFYPVDNDVDSTVATFKFPLTEKAVKCLTKVARDDIDQSFLPM